MKPLAAIQPPPRPVSPFENKLAGNNQSGSVEAGSNVFANLLADRVGQVNTMQQDANQMVHSLLTGGDVNEAEVLTAVQKADLAFRMLIQIRNKLMDAYREIQQIQI